MNKLQIINRDMLKYIAIIAMTFNHIAHTLLEPDTTMYIIFESIGYFTAITMSYLMVEGFHYTKSRKKYICRLTVFALISQIPFALMVESWLTFNVMFSLLLSFLMMCVLNDKNTNRFTKIVTVFAIFIASMFCDWPIILPFSTLGFYLSKSNKLLLSITYIATAMLSSVLVKSRSLQATSFLEWISIASTIIIPLCVSAIVCLVFYNHKQSEKCRKINKYIFYVYYPTHILILTIIRHAIS